MDLDYIPPAGSTTRKVEKEVSQANAAESKVSINEKVVQFRKNEKKKGKVSAVEPTSGPQAAVYPKNKGSSVVSLKLSASMRQEARKDNSASRSHSDLNPAAKSKASEYEKKGEVFLLIY
ncbi:uncharacterized protein LOC143053701 [Mytilus galloprovincialis]|uniref:uncharacterized protein LOC143053701 n=1 Tax=Mytilus galloprovincialis TaxID=29158 RepID=UPI003F7BD49E